MGVQHIVQPGTTENVVLSGLADGIQHISVFVGDTDLSFSISMVCDVQVSPPAPEPGTAAQTVLVLPATGPADVTPLLAIAFGSVLLGGALLVCKRRLGAS
jgi:LPXTG-motif cell wall-anchored protein